MKQTVYLPEGLLIDTEKNKEYISSLSGLEAARAGGIILEGMAVMCDSFLSLEVELGNGIKGVIPREEVVWESGGNNVKDIAVITRVGKAVCFKVKEIRLNEEGKAYCILSRREAMRECYECYLSYLEPGDVVRSKVTHLEHFGAFVDIGCGNISLLSIDCISVSRISHPSDRFHVGQHIKTVIKSVDRETGRIYVTHKELLGTWEENASLFSVGQTVAGIVRSIEDYGIFVELTPNLAGLAEYREGITVGQTAAVYIKNIIPERMKIKLVLIDSYKGEKTADVNRLSLNISEKNHIFTWRYSPENSAKQIETFFS
ncbi:MAG: S1 RNA-binding domain-containing protein [Clostridia bacterium]|nr:S1 RNA-binding domain-containing protein [Clostridia bacterium]